MYCHRKSVEFLWKVTKMNTSFEIGFLLYPQVTQLDLTGPVQVLSRVPGAHVHLLWKSASAIPTDAGFSINATTAFADCPQLDVICVPGGRGIGVHMQDAEVIAFLQRQGENARYVTSVCNGSLLLGAAGLVNGYQSACHWMWMDYLPRFGAIPVNARVVRDRNRISGGGVTAGIDFGFVLAAELAGEEVAKAIQLGLEYDPQPPFDYGSPEKAGPELEARLRELQRDRIAQFEQQLEKVALYPASSEIRAA
jgi:cyclohexyl-isocyanide hydratase